MKFLSKLYNRKFNNVGRKFNTITCLLIPISCVLYILGLFSCKKFVTIAAPVNQLVAEQVFNDNSVATSAQTSIYAQMSSSGILYEISLFTGLSSDELRNYSNDVGSIQYYSNAIDPTLERASDIWSPAYNYIYQANAIISGVKNSSTISSGVANQLIGESEFIRAFWHFYLTNLFGDVPLVTGTDYTLVRSISRTKQADVYKQIVSDLIDAQSKLSNNYIDGTDTTITDDRTRPNIWTAKALLARVYLYLKEWSNAEALATEIINNRNLYDTVSLNNVFLKNTKEAIWQLQAVVPGQNTLEGYNFILTGIPGGYLYNASTVSDELINNFEMNDNRKTNWISNIAIGSKMYYFPYKYKISSSSNITEYSMVFRISEQYLIRAEARAELNNIDGAQSDLNLIRSRAGLLNANSNSQAEILHSIQAERMVELFTEGHRWFDLKRTGNVNSVMSLVTPLKGGLWNSNWQLYPIPQSEINNDLNLSQNSGY